MVGTIKFTVTSRTSAPPDFLMHVLSDWQDLPRYWHGMREIREDSGNMLRVKFAFPGEAKMSYLCDPDSMTCTENYHSGPFTGFKRLEFEADSSGTSIVARWEVQLSLRLLMFRGFIMKHFREGTENAISRIIEEAENLVVSSATSN